MATKYKGILGEPIYKHRDCVRFLFNGKILEGIIGIVDSYGTMEQKEEPCYGKWRNNKRQYEIDMDIFLMELCSEQKMAQNLKLEKCIIPQLIIDELHLYRRKLSEFQAYFIVQPGIQYFEYECFVGTGRFVIVWDISKVEKIVNNERVIRRKITVSELYEIVDKSGFEYETKSYNAEKPPVIAYYKPFNTYVIIDGNHRIYDAYHSGKRK